MPVWILVALGSALGGLARWALVPAIEARTGSQFPWGTLAVNVLGGGLIGLCLGVLGREATRSPQWALLAIGLLGGFTTFSAYSLQTLVLIQDGRLGWALAYAAGSVAACLLACWAGHALGRLAFG